MRKSFAKQEAPLLIGVVREEKVRTAIAAIRNCEYHGATGIDLHLSTLKPEAQTVEAMKQIIDACRLPMLALNYSNHYDGTGYEDDEESRVELLMRSVEAGVACVDFQGYTFDRPSKSGFRQEFAHLGYSFIKNNPKEIVVDPDVIDRQMELFDRVHHAGAEVLLSTHPGVNMNCEQVVELAHFLAKRKPDVIKIVAPVNNDEELAECIRTMLVLKKEFEGSPIRVHYHGCNKAGSITRLLNPLLGGYLIFCNDVYTESSNFDQLDLQTAKSVMDGLKKIMM